EEARRRTSQADQRRARMEHDARLTGGAEPFRAERRLRVVGEHALATREGPATTGASVSRHELPGTKPGGRVRPPTGRARRRTIRPRPAQPVEPPQLACPGVRARASMAVVITALMRSFLTRLSRAPMMIGGSAAASVSGRGGSQGHSARIRSVLRRSMFDPNA